MEELIERREVCRFRRHFPDADAIRKTLSETYGVVIDDKGGKWNARDGSHGTIPSFASIEQKFSAVPPPMPPPAPTAALDLLAIEKLIEDREYHRYHRNFPEADRLRSLLSARGVNVEDKTRTWSRGTEHGTIPSYDEMLRKRSGGL